MKNQGEEKNEVIWINYWALVTATASYLNVEKGLVKGPQLLLTVAESAFPLAFFWEAQS